MSKIGVDVVDFGEDFCVAAKTSACLARQSRLNQY
jgi:hypothetical protein